MNQPITFRCATNRDDRKTKHNRWNKDCRDNTTVGDGFVGSDTRFGSRVKDSTIIRSYLYGYQWGRNEDGSYNSTPIHCTIWARPGHPDYNLTFTVSLSTDGRWATVMYTPR